MATAGGGSLGILVLDLITPPDVIVCLLYPVLLVLAPVRGAQLIGLATVGAGFTILAGFIEPSLGDPSLVWLNRALVVACLASCAALLCWSRANDALAVLRRQLTPRRSPVTQFFDSLRRTRALDHAAIPVTARARPPVDDLAGPDFVIETMATLVILDTLAHGALCTVDELCAAVIDARPPGLDHADLVPLVERRLAVLCTATAIAPTADGRWQLNNDASNDNRR